MHRFRLCFFSFLLLGFLFFFSSCEKSTSVESSELIGCQVEGGACLDDHSCCLGVVSGDGLQERLAYIEKGYTEIEITPIIKNKCYFSDWDKEILTPVSGLFEYYDAANSWVASIDFGDGSCDEWATKTWDVNVFPEHPNGKKDFSVFEYKLKSN